MNTETQKGHPKGLYVLFVTEMWERFSYYGMRALFTLFLLKSLLFDKDFTSQIYGSYTGLVYLTPLIGGYMADRYWGNRKSIVVGGLLMALGQFFMFLSGSFYAGDIEFAKMMMFVGLGFLIFGNGFFKPNISTMVGQLYPQGDTRVDGAFTIFYMGINLGAFVAPLLCGALGDTGNPADFKWGFLAACIGMIVSVLLFVSLKNHYLVTPEGKAIGGKPEKVAKEENETPNVKMSSKVMVIWGAIWLVLFGGFYLWLDGDIIGSFIFSLMIAAPGLIISDPNLTKIEKQRIWVIYIVAFFVIFFWSAFEQAGASLTYFAEEQTQREVGLVFSKTTVMIITAVIGLIIAYFSTKVWKSWMNSKGWPMGITILTFLWAIVFGLIYAITKNKTGNFELNTIPASAFQSVNAIAIVIFAPLFALIWSALSKRKMEPASPYKQAIGLFLLAIGYLIIAFGVKGLAPGVKVNMMWLISLYTIHTFGELCLSPIGLSMVNKLAPLKLASLLMGVWFLSTAAANKFAGTLSSYYPEPVVKMELINSTQTDNAVNLLPKDLDVKNLKEIDGEKVFPLANIQLYNIENKALKETIKTTMENNQIVPVKSFIGFQIKNLYDFFMLFVFMAGASSIILFFLSRKLVKMMHGVK